MPKGPDAAFVCNMEDVLDLYQQPYDEKRPTVCMDEMSRQLLEDTRAPLPPKSGEVAKEDFEYRRNGTANLFLLCEPLTGRVAVKVTQRRTKADWAAFIKELVDEHYPAAEQIRLVLDNLNTHVKASLYEVFEPAEAKRLCDKLEIHYTPKHGSWLNMAEIELSVLARQCLARRLKDLAMMRQEVAAWVAERKKRPVVIQWQFTTADARIKLKRLYPSIQSC